MLTSIHTFLLRQRKGDAGIPAGRARLEVDSLHCAVRVLLDIAIRNQLIAYGTRPLFALQPRARQPGNQQGLARTRRRRARRLQKLTNIFRSRFTERNDVIASNCANFQMNF